MATAYPVPDPRLNFQPYATEESFDNQQEILRLLSRGGGVQPAPQQAPASQPPAAVQRALPRTVESLRGRAGDIYQQGMALANQEPDTSALQEYARQRGQQGNAAMINALAAQFAGESFAPMQAQFLKQAAAAQDPMKLSGGILTADGKFLKDPFASQDKKANMLLQLARHYEQMALTAETAQQRADALRERQAVQDQFRMLTLEIQRDRAGQGSFEYAGTGPDGLPVVLNKKSGVLTTQGGQTVTGPITPKGGDKTSESERTAAGYLTRMRAAENILGSLPVESQSPGYVERGAQYLPGEMGRDVANLTRDALRGRAYQAQQDWVRAKLRKESGAVIGVQEMNDEIRTYFPMPGDGPEVIAQKAAARKQAERQFEIGAGNALKEALKTPSGSGLSPAEQAEYEALKKKYGR